MERREKFGTLSDLGIITAPPDFVPVSEFEGGSFPNPSWVIRPGQRIWVRAHNQVVSGTTTSEERLAFLASLESYLPSAQGASLILEQKPELLPGRQWYGFFDKREHLWEDVESRDFRVPGILVGGGSFLPDLGFFKRPWNGFYSFLSFCDEPEHLMGLS